MELYDVMHTTFAAREFLDEPVTDEVIYSILDHARYAPSGGNRQGWKTLIVRSSETREALVPLLAPVLQRYRAQKAIKESPFNTINPTRLSEAEIEATRVPHGVIRNLIDAPVLLFILVDLSAVASFDQSLDRVGVISGASIYPFVWNILLAARHEGYGGTPTTFIGAQEPALKALLGIPDCYAFAAMIPLGKPVKQLTKLSRKPVETFTMHEHWQGKPLIRNE